MTKTREQLIEEHMKKEIPIGRTLGDYHVREAFKIGATFGCKIADDELAEKDVEIEKQINLKVQAIGLYGLSEVKIQSLEAKVKELDKENDELLLLMAKINSEDADKIQSLQTKLECALTALKFYSTAQFDTGYRAREAIEKLESMGRIK